VLGCVKGVHAIVHLLWGEPSLGASPPHTNLNFIPSEITSGAFSDSFVVLKYMMR
jgi:hypothetical protein